MSPAQINKLLHAAGNHESYLRDCIANAKPGYDVPVPRGYLQRVVTTLGKLATLAAVDPVGEAVSGEGAT